VAGLGKGPMDITGGLPMRTYNITITGTQPLLLHHDDIEWADRMESWKNDKDNKKKSKAGDDRSPAFRWLGCLYRDDAGEIIIPTENIMRALMEGGAMVLVPGGRSGKTFKSQSQSGIMPRSVGWPLLLNGSAINAKALAALMKVADFTEHLNVVKKLGFSLMVKRAKVGASKHIRVRPMFSPPWSCNGELVVTDDQITSDVLCDILEMAGKYKGLGDWRPGAKTPGTFGMFSATVEQLN
jgi:hypothetical protein